MTEVNNKQAKNLGFLLSRENLSQKSFSKKIGTNEITVSRWIHDKNAISTDYARKINAAYPDYSIEFILGNSDYPNETFAARDEFVGALQSAFAENYHIEKLLNHCGITSIELFGESNERVRLNKDEQSLVLTADQYFAFQDELKSYVKMRLDSMFERGCW